MCTRPVPLRILYTINSSPQYILARSHSPVPVSAITYSLNPHPSHPSHNLYATAALKACLDSICRSRSLAFSHISLSSHLIITLAQNWYRTQIAIFQSTSSILSNLTRLLLLFRYQTLKAVTLRHLRLLPRLLRRRLNTLEAWP